MQDEGNIIYLGWDVARGGACKPRVSRTGRGVGEGTRRRPAPQSMGIGDAEKLESGK